MRLLGIDDARLLIDLDAQQPLQAFIADHVDAFGDVLDGLRIAEADQRNGAQQIAFQAEFQPVRIAVGDGDQAVAIRIEGQRRQVIVDTGDDLALDRDPVVRQSQRGAAALLALLPLGEVEPAALEQTVVNAGRHGQ